MNLTQFTNYSFRILTYVALNEGRPSSIKSVANAYGISYNHLKKVASFLIEKELLLTVRGRSGGVILAKEPEQIFVGDVIRKTEPSFTLFECFGPLGNGRCPLISVCALKSLLGEALGAFFAVIDKATLADLIKDQRSLKMLLSISDRSLD